MLMRRMGADWTPHGFRSTFRTWCSDVAHVEFEVAESCLSHCVGNAVSRAYNRSDMLERRRPVMERCASFLSGEADSKVVAINGRRKRP
jgi:integrase